MTKMIMIEESNVHKLLEWIEHASVFIPKHRTFSIEGTELANVLQKSLEQQSNSTINNTVSLTEEETKFLKQVVGVAVCGLYENYPKDVVNTFEESTLQKIVESTSELTNERVEDIYKNAWSLLSAKLEKETVNTKKPKIK